MEKYPERSPILGAEEQTKIRPRGYQFEMLQQSLAGNIIVAMDTGSGKTQIAIMRIEEELKRCSTDKLVWFLAPSVALCDQQHQKLQEGLPSYQHRFLSGKDNVDKWTEQRLWDAVLKNIRIVVSTPQVLLDALGNGFVNMNKLALIVFDEAHRCLNDSPMSQIMIYFYHQMKQVASADQLPSILGLTASPILRDDISELQSLESTLNARTTTPKLCRLEMAEYVHLPALSVVNFDANVSQPMPQTLLNLDDIVKNYDLMDDPYTLKLMESAEPSANGQLLKLMNKQKTYCLEQLKILRNRAVEVHLQLGSFAADWFLRKCIRKFGKQDDDLQLLDFEWSDEEKAYLVSTLQKVLSTCPELALEDDPYGLLSHKATKLLKVLVEHVGPHFTGIVFAKQRATVAALAELVSQHPATRSLFKVGSFVGTSSTQSRKAFISDLADTRQQDEALSLFRLQDRDLMIATSVLEEGIDVPSCHFVVCFDEPDNLVSYIQRRGRARKKESKYVMFVSQTSARISKFDSLEQKMIEQYQNDSREVEQACSEETLVENFHRTMKVSSTGALLTMHNALSHLHHFCQTLGADCTDLRPQFTIEEDCITKLRRAKVVLPILIAQELRVTESREYWRTERAAVKDAAFESCVNLFKAGLVNDNLLPWHLSKAKEYVEKEPEQQSEGLVSVALQLNPWISVANSWSEAKEAHLYKIVIDLESTSRVVQVLFPTRIQTFEKVTLHWNETTKYSVSVKFARSVTLKAAEVEAAQEFTKLFLLPIFGQRIDESRVDFVAPFIAPPQLDTQSIRWELLSGSRPAADLLPDTTRENIGLVRDQQNWGTKYIFNTRCVAKPSRADQSGFDEELCIEATKLPKRRDFLHEVSYSNARPVEYTTHHYLPVRDCTIDNFPSEVSILALFVPSIMHILEIRMIAERLRVGVLKPVGIHNLDLILEAICSPSAREQKNYERFEFLGDCILKFYTTLYLLKAHPNWPESYLTVEKGRMVSNETLAKAASATGLHQFIITKAFTGQSWRPLYVGDLAALESKQENRILSRKVSADVVEALIGASFLDGAAHHHEEQLDAELCSPFASGVAKATRCLGIFLPDGHWKVLSTTLSELTESSSSSRRIPPSLTEVEELVGYPFRNKQLLLSALTHSSYSAETNAVSYQRLEFLGDAVLDIIVTTHLFDKQDPPFTHYQLHTARESLVNGDFLAFLCMEWGFDQEREEVIQVGKEEFETERKSVKRYLWQFILSGSDEIAQARREHRTRHQAMRADILAALTSGERFPWAKLCSVHAPKFVSDIVESTLGAVFIDSMGDVTACEKMLERMGLMGHLRRVKANGDTMKLVHPKEELGRLAVSETVRYDFKLVENEKECAVFIGDKEVAVARGGVSRFEMETRAADEAVRRLTSGQSLGDEDVSVEMERQAVAGAVEF